MMLYPGYGNPERIIFGRSIARRRWRALLWVAPGAALALYLVAHIVARVVV